MLRVGIEFKTSEIPQAYGIMICSVIKAALKKEDEEYYNNLYFYEGKKNKKTKNFTYSIYIKNYELKEGAFYIKDKIVVNISTPEYEFFQKLYNGFLNIKEFKYKGKYILNRGKIFLNEEKQISNGEVIFKTLSPIFIKDKNNNSIIFNDEKFNTELNYISNIILKEYRGFGLNEELLFKNIDMKKKVSKLEISDFKEKTNKKFMCVDTNSGIFKLSGDTKDLRDLYMLGLGFRRNEGLGMVDIF